MLVKFKQNRMVQTTWNFELFDKKRVFYSHFWQRADAILEDVSDLKLLFNAILVDVSDLKLLFNAKLCI